MSDRSDETVDQSLDIEETGDPLAALAHRLWTHWSQHIAEEEPISEERIDRWRALWIPYEDLPEGAKETDRRLAERYADEAPEYDRLADTETENDRDRPADGA